MTRTQTEQYEPVTGVWEDGRIGAFRGLRGGKRGYGGTAFGSSGTGSVGGSDGYVPPVIEIARFFRTGPVPVNPEETISIYAFMEAADESKCQGFAPVSVQSVIEKAATEAASKVAALIAAPQAVSQAVRHLPGTCCNDYGCFMCCGGWNQIDE